MGKYLRLLFSIAACAVVLAGCDQLASGGVTVSGTVGGTSISAFGDATVTVSDGSSSFSTSIPVPVADQNGYQGVQYSLAGVPSGTYAITVTFFAYDGNLDATYKINGGQELAPDSFGCVTSNQQEWEYTLIVNSVSIQSDETLDTVILPFVGR